MLPIVILKWIKRENSLNFKFRKERNHNGLQNSKYINLKRVIEIESMTKSTENVFFDIMSNYQDFFSFKKLLSAKSFIFVRISNFTFSRFSLTLRNSTISFNVFTFTNNF